MNGNTLRWLAATGMIVLSALIVWSLIPAEVRHAVTSPSASRPPATVPATAPATPPAVGFAAYAGSAACAQCHQKAYDAHVQTAHFHTSAPAEAGRIKGTFAEGRNVVALEGGVNARMVERDGRHYQEAVADGGGGGGGGGGGADSLTRPSPPAASQPTQRQQSRPFDIVIGSGRRGQSYLFWARELLYQLPISYWSPADSWINSPGFPRDRLQFDRPILAECLQCHATYVRRKDFPTRNQYDRSQVIYGVDCERCHGPAAEHTSFHLNHPAEREARHVVRIATLTRQQRLDVCAQCHSGVRETSIEPFTFRPGDTIADKIRIEYGPADPAELDVHSNQTGLLAASACFRAGGTMTCSSCHDPHATQHDVMLFSRRCLDCHKTVESCGLAHSQPAERLANCVECHMPTQASRNLRVQRAAGAKDEPLRVRTHRIAVYSEHSDAVLKAILDTPPKAQ